MKIKQSDNIQENRYKAKPIFKQEKEFIEAHIPEIAPLPDDCWIVGGSTKTVYLDLYSNKPYIKFKVENGGKFIIQKDNRELFKDYTPVTISETLNRESKRVNKLYNNCVNRLAEYVNKHSNKVYKISHSGGKDSELTMSVWNDMLKEIKFTPDYEFIFFNTSNEVADIYKRIKQIPNIKIINPKIGWRQWIKNNNYTFPNVFRRSCCSTYKEGQATKTFDNNAEIVQVLGVRKYESVKRAKYEFLMDFDFDSQLFGKSKLPKKWVKLAPIIDLQNIDVWLLMLIKKLPINRRYLIGSSRVGCLICPYSSTYEDEIIKIYYPYQYKWFREAIAKNYKIFKAKRLGWTEEEWADGVWKSAQCKNHHLLQKQSTNENIKLYADLKGLSQDMAKKYFNRVCGKCGKSMRENELAMFFKLFGRYENQVDNREVLCKKCVCEQLGISKREYEEKNIEFIEQGCNLF